MTSFYNLSFLYFISYDKNAQGKKERKKKDFFKKNFLSHHIMLDV